MQINVAIGRMNFQDGLEGMGRERNDAVANTRNTAIFCDRSDLKKSNMISIVHRSWLHRQNLSADTKTVYPMYNQLRYNCQNNDSYPSNSYHAKANFGFEQI